MKIYTKTGDKGSTSLYGGTRVSKSNLKVHTYGEVDELNSYIGLIRSYNEYKNIDSQLSLIQNSLFNIGAELATPIDKMVLANGEPRLSHLVSEKEIEQLELWIDLMNEELPPLTQFILPTGSIISSTSHIARSVCRRAERSVVALNEIENAHILCSTYLNRLSDYLFVLARYFGNLAEEKEIFWTTNE